ncbi:AMP-dependent synthetase and ligase [Verminephrobacter eiseniae EF01-2]|uniref:AMP-dependent synthetase and ligase n=1 Tax=Verminephrobacter eiseniae (strain EF01-2) TaxID=391735 RepID=A1WPM5_VEREI|nr:AMP-dependent synthetase and ligase [Verminephrobacter eiseniae EF01-2]MCW5285101.1 long-chain fatty acid--CoA ligase [Verminephrobacter eiseniae]MCW5302809.1 long-chain fatty acid--CoA ligase [Verminephrobacter eiseniae]MCW8180190.1 long-chain fatty acid--CoA ligase [Verminephrobacter eiseniae]MCW8191464.1 long-chain fatty acid--CoA ligase [Verminephrobacter eiseniae]
MNPNLLIYNGGLILPGTQLQAQADRAAAGFEQLGLRAGDTVAVMLRNDVPYLELMLALNQLGIHLVAVNWHFQAEEAAYVLRDSGAQALVIHADLWPTLAPAVPPDVRVLVVPTPQEIIDAYGLAPAPLPDQALQWAQWRDGFAPSMTPPVPSPGSMLYTSGTTGRPKAVMRLPGTPPQHEGTMRVRAMASHAREGMRTALVGPLYHAGPNTAARVALRLAERIVVLPRFDAEQLLRTIEQHRLTHLSLVPVMLVRLLKLPREVRERYDLSSLENVTHGGSPCAPEVRRAIIDWWGPIVNETYGSTEIGLVTMVSAQEWLQRPGTAGRPFPGTSVRILGPEGQILPPGETGEIYVDPGDNALPFTYRNDAAARQAIERDGHITNGDMGYLDADGYLYVTDRKRDMVISGGVNIYPAEIEHVLVTHPEVADCAVFGIPDAEYGEALAAAVVRSPGSSLDAEQVRDWMRQRMAGYKVPRHVEFHAALPREGMGKVFKNQLRAPHWERAGRRI